MLHDNNLIEWFLRLNRSEPLFRTIRELPGIGKIPGTRDDTTYDSKETYHEVSWSYGKSQQKLLYLESY